MATKERYEYVELNEPHIIREDMAQTSNDFAQEIIKSHEFQNLLQQKHKSIASAKLLLSKLKQDVRELQASMHKEDFVEKKVKIEPKKTVSKEEVEKSFIDSKKALENLKSNIDDLKKHLSA